MTSQAQAAAPLPGVRGLAFLGFPLHPAGSRRASAASICSTCRSRCCSCKARATRWPMLDQIEPCARRSARAPRCELFDDADHSFHVPARSGRTDAQVMGEMLDAFAAWIDDRPLIAVWLTARVWSWPHSTTKQEHLVKFFRSLSTCHAVRRDYLWFAAAICMEYAMAPRPYWKGYLKLSLVACPIAVFTATTSRERVSFRQINKQTGNRLRQQLVDDVTREPVEAADKGRGYEVDKNVYIQVEDEEIEALADREQPHDRDRQLRAARADRRALSTTAPITSRRTTRSASEAFAVIRDAMRGKDMVALGRIVLAKRERVIALQPWDKGLLGTTLRYAYEVRNAGGIFRRDPDIKIPKEMLQLAEHILETKAGDFDPATFVDHYEEAVVEMLQAEAGRRAGVEAEGGRARVERRQPDGCAQAQRRGGERLGQSRAGEEGQVKAKPDDLRRQPQFKFPIEGGKAKQPKAAAAPRGKHQGKAQAQVGLALRSIIARLYRTPRLGRLAQAASRFARDTVDACAHDNHALCTALPPQPLRREPRALDQRAELGPGDLGVHAAAEAAVGAGDDVLAADRAGEAHDALGDELRVLDQVGGVADHAGHQHLAVRQLDVLPHLPFVLVAHVGRLERIALRLDLQHQVDDVLERQVVGVRPVPAAPAQVIAHAVLRNALAAHG